MSTQIFIGGTGRCGTTVLGQALEELPDTIYFIEPGIIVSPGGILDLLIGKICFNTFRTNVNFKFRSSVLGTFRSSQHVRNIQIDDNEFYTQAQTNQLLDILEKDITKNGTYKFITEYIQLGLTYFNVSNFIYKTPNLIGCIDFLQKAFKDSTFIHVIRDPLDIYCSVLTKHWGPSNIDQFTYWYNHYMCRALKLYKECNKDKYVVVSIESILANPKIALSHILTQIGVSTQQVIPDCIRHFNKHDAHIHRHIEEIKPREKEEILNKCYDLYELWLEEESPL